MSWLRSFWLHPFANRFNLLYLAAWATVCWTTEGHLPFLIGLSVEAAYLLGRSYVESNSGNAWWRLRKLRWPRKNRFLALWKKAHTVRRDLDSVSGAEGMLGASGDQVDRLLKSFLELLILDERIERYLRYEKTDHRAKIAELEGKLAVAEGEMAKIIEKNLDLTRQRWDRYKEVSGRREVVSGRLATIENTMDLLKDAVMGMGVKPDEVSENVDLLVQNVQDAENFVSELSRLEPLTRVKG